MKRRTACISLLLAPLMGGCGKNPLPTKTVKIDDGKVDVLCSFFPIYLFTKNIVGDRPDVNVTLMVPAAMGCPHDYDLTPADVKKLAGADIFVMNGGGLEEFGREQVEKENPGIVIVDASHGIEGIAFADDHEAEHSHGVAHDHKHGHDDDADHDDKGERHEDGDEKHDHKDESAKKGATKGHDHDNHDHDTGHDDKHGHDDDDAHGHDDDHDHGHDHEGEFNPHYFSSPQQAIQQVRRIAEGLAKADPEGAEVYRKNAAEYTTRLDELSAEFKDRLGKLKNNRIVTMHEVFDYLARDYGLEIVATIHAAPGHEPSPADMRGIIETIKRKGAAAVCTEPQYALKVADEVAKESGVPVFELDPIASGPPDADADYYERKMRANIEALAAALGGADS